MVFCLAVKLKDHRLKPGGVLEHVRGVVCSWEVEVPPAEAGGVQEGFEGSWFVAVKLKDHRLKPVVSKDKPKRKILPISH